MAKMAVKLERVSPSSSPLSEKEETSFEEAAAAADEHTAAVSDADDESSDTEAGDAATQKPLSHQQAMEHFKDALAEIVVVCNSFFCCIMGTYETRKQIIIKCESVHKSSLTITLTLSP